MYYEELLDEERCEELVDVLDAYYGDEPWTDEPDWDGVSVAEAYNEFKDEGRRSFGRQADKYADKIAVDAVMGVLLTSSRDFKRILKSERVTSHRYLVKPWMKEFVLD